jgi:HAE1 family hydrophobic/amphiphilic exporter-1
MKLQLEKILVGAKVKTVPGILGTAEDAPINCYRNKLRKRYGFAKAAEKELNKSQSHWSKIICRNWKS